MAGVVCSALVGIGKCACPYLEEPVGYLMHFNDNVKDLKDRVQELVARKEHIDRLVSTGCSYGEETPEVRLWLTRAAQMIQEAATIQQKVAEDKGCLHCLNLRWRYSLSKQAKQMTERIVTHYDKVNPDKMKMTMPPSLPTVINEEAPSIQGLPSVESSLQEVMSALRDENTKIIGVWGMGGVGKTTLVKNVNNGLHGTQQFNKVIMVTISEDVDIERIQGDIAERLGFTLRDGTESSRARDLRSGLMKEETFLIILDDLWAELNLAAVGIPSPNSLEGCKIIFTTRNEDVCQGMESQVDIQVKVLSEEESWKLFKEKAGAVVDNSSLQSKAKEVLKECGGLPLAIITLGRALRGRRNPKEWDNALSQLKKSVPSDIKGMQSGVYHSIKISYDHLRPQLKPAFLFCCLFPEDYNIHVDTLIRLWKGEGFLEDVESLEEALNKGHTLVEELKSSSLLLAGEVERYVKMHDIVRDVAIWISSKECKEYKSFVRIGSKGLPMGKSWEEYRRISLWWNVNKLPEGMHCPKLLTLMMPGNKQPTEIPGWFWEAAKDLRVLDLSMTDISKIPVPSNLVNLRVLCLSHCMFEEGNCLSALGGLKQLELLDLSLNDWLCELPNEIGELVNLRSLDLTDTVHLKIVPSGVISRLTLLEELKMWNSFHEWKAEEKDASSSSSCNASLSEVASLKELSNLHLCIVEVERLPRDYPLFKHPTKLKKFCFCICPRPDEGFLDLYYPESYPDELRYMEIDGCSLIPEWALRLLPQTTHLKLKDCKGREALNRGGGFSSLKYLTVEKCDDVEFVVSAKESPENAFGNLQSLELNYLPNLKKVVTKYEEGLLPTHLLHNLKELRVEKCPELKHLLPSVLLQGMDNLTDVRVGDCEGMEHLFDGPPTVERRNDVLSKLETLDLSNLTSMTSIWPMGLVVNLQKLVDLDILYCHGLKKSVVSAMQMKGGLPNLVKLRVADCGVEEIISDVVDNEGLLPKLENLRLSSLPELVRIYGGGEAVPPPQLDWHSLKTIEVHRCPKLKKVQALQGGADSVVDLSRTAISKIPLSNLVNLRVLCLRSCKFEEGNCLSALGGLKQLESLDLSFNDWLCELPNEIGELVNLRSLDLTNTINLKIVPSGVISRLTLLKELKMWNSFQEWKAEEKDASSSSSSNAYLSEVASLKELSNLHLCIVEVERLPRDYPLFKHPTKLKEFRFRICHRPDDGVVDHMYPVWNPDELKYMELVGNSLIPEWALMLLPETTHLNLINCKGQETLNRGGGFPSLKSLTVRKCDDVEFVVSAKESPENAFGNLLTIRLTKLPNLKKVVTKYEEGLLPTHLLHNLKELTVKKCPELKHLLPSVLLQGMDNLTDVRVSKCGGMEHLFDGPPTVEQSNDVLSKLETLDLAYLTSMTSIWPKGLVVNLQNLATLDVSDCHGLKQSVVSAMQMKGGLPNLYRLSVNNCNGVEEIISDVVDNEGLLLKLRILKLIDLPKLVRICGGEADPLLQLDWNSLEEIRVLRCGGMEHVFDGPPTDVFFKLKTSNLRNLTTLVLWRCHFFKKTVMSSVQMKGGLPNLVNLTVDDCGGVEEIISDVVDNEGLLPKLENLRLSSLPELVRIYGGGEAVPLPQLDWHSLETIYVYGCPKLKKVQPLQGGADSVPLLREIKGERNWWEELDWEGDDRVISQFHSLFKEERPPYDEDEWWKIQRYREIVHLWHTHRKVKNESQFACITDQKLHLIDYLTVTLAPTNGTQGASFESMLSSIVAEDPRSTVQRKFHSICNSLKWIPYD